MRRLVPALVLAFLWVSTLRAAEHPEFDRVLTSQSVDLGIAEGTMPVQHKKVNCTYYRDMMVKEIDLAEEGDDSISVLPAGKGHLPLCQLRRVPKERIIPADDVPVYFQGRKGPYLFIISADGADGVNQVRILSRASLKPLFITEVAIGGDSIFDTIRLHGNRLRLTYRTNDAADCSLLTGGDSCARKVMARTGLAILPPCRAGYDQALQQQTLARCENVKGKPDCSHAQPTAGEAKQMEDDPSVIFYKVVSTVGPKGGVTVNAANPDPACAAAE